LLENFAIFMNDAQSEVLDALIVLVFHQPVAHVQEENARV
jgi:hypothetical protein